MVLYRYRKYLLYNQGGFEMDHAIDYLEQYMTMDKELFIEQWKSGQYEKLEDCPSYGEVKAYCDALRILMKQHYDEKVLKESNLTPRSIIKKAYEN